MGKYPSESGERVHVTDDRTDGRVENAGQIGVRVDEISPLFMVIASMFGSAGVSKDEMAKTPKLS